MRRKNMESEACFYTLPSEGTVMMAGIYARREGCHAGLTLSWGPPEVVTSIRKKTKRYTNTVTITCHLPPRTIPDWRRSNRVLIRGLDAAALHCIQRAHCPALNSNAVHGWHGIKVTESINMYSKYSALRRTANDARLILHIQTINHSHWTVAASDLTTHVTPLNCLSQRTCVCVDVRVNMCVDVRVNVCVD